MKEKPTSRPPADRRYESPQVRDLGRLEDITQATAGTGPGETSATKT